MAIRFETDASALSADDLRGGFFEGWHSAPEPETHLRMLRDSYRVVVAREDPGGRVIGFATAISDGVLAAYVPLIEVLPPYRGGGVGAEILRRLLVELDDLYMVDLVCDPSRVGFYERAGFVRGTAMMQRRYDRQSGASRR